MFEYRELSLHLNLDKIKNQINLSRFSLDQWNMMLRLKKKKQDFG